MPSRSRKPKTEPQPALPPTDELRKAEWSAPMWQAYVCGGRDRDDRRTRLAEVPQEWRGRVERHVRTWWQIRDRAASKVYGVEMPE